MRSGKEKKIVLNTGKLSKTFHKLEKKVKIVTSGTDQKKLKKNV